jgi:hypothetical protein
MVRLKVYLTIEQVLLFFLAKIQKKNANLGDQSPGGASPCSGVPYIN